MQKVSPKTWKPKMRASVVALLYLVWPGMCSEVFALFACRDVCGETRLRADLGEVCFEGRHAAFAVGLGVPMLLVYILGLPIAALSMVYRLHKKARALEKHVNGLKGHLTFGLFYSAFRPEVWWWEGTVAVRKIGIAAVGVFGGSMRSMQVHATSLMMFANIVLTAQAQPFGDRAGLQRLEQGLLICTWLTLWAGTIFNSHPRCEDADGGPGATLGWCDGLSVMIGLADAAAGVAALLYFLHLKGLCRCCLAKCFGKAQAAGDGAVEGMQQAHSTQGLPETPAGVRQRTVDAADTTTVVNPVAGAEEKSREIELTDMHTNPMRRTKMSSNTGRVGGGRGGRGGGGGGTAAGPGRRQTAASKSIKREQIATAGA